MTAMTPERLAEIRERAGAATQGPWEHRQPFGTQNHAVITADGDLGNDNEGVWYEETDAEFIAHSREDVPDLLAHVDHLTAEVERLRADVRSLQRGSQRNADAHMVTHRDNARLRAGIERVRGHVHESWLTQGDVGLIEDALDDCDALLNPPTEGEPHDPPPDRTVHDAPPHHGP